MDPEASPSPRPPEPQALPFAAEQLRGLLRHPHLLPDVVLGAPARVAASVLDPASRRALLPVLLGGSALFAIPYGLVLEPGRAWRIGILLLGTLAICFPSLHVFGAYVGRKITLAQNLALGLVIPCVAAVFTFGFFPIVWFLRATMDEGTRIGPGDLSSFLLVVSLVAGLGQIWRCTSSRKELQPAGPTLFVMVGWHVLFLFIAFRLASVLGLA